MSGTISTATVGRHSELLAISALLANGWTVLEPVVPEPFDLAITRKGEANVVRAQVKTMQYREDRDSYVVKAVRSGGRTYTLEDCDIFIAVLGTRVFTFDNREITEYWCNPAELTEKWTELPTGLGVHRVNNLNETEAV